VAENEFISSVEAYLNALPLLPKPASLGINEPGEVSALPALVISLEDTHVAHPGIGKRNQLMIGALHWTATIDLADPVLPSDPSFPLLDAARTTLILPHGGQVRRDGSAGVLSAADVGITVAGTGLVLTAAHPTGNHFAIDALSGTVTLGSPLPGSGSLVASYYLGQWEQRIARIAGTLRVDICAAATNDVRTLADAVVAAFDAPSVRQAIRGLNALSVSGVSSVGPRDPQFANSHRRSLRLAYDFEAEVNLPDSSGGIIHRIPIAGPSPPPHADDSQFLS